MQNLKFAIGIPTINRYDLLAEALSKYFNDFPETDIYIVDNGNQGIPDHERLIVSRPENNLGVAASWNRLCTSIFNNHDYAVIINDDIYWGKTEKEVKNYLKNNEDTGFFCTEFNWCLWIISKKTYNLVGQFDEKFYPAYFEDNDMARRFQLSGVTRLNTAFCNPITYRNSQTIQKDPLLNNGFMNNKNYYISKWGGEPGNEKYITPFNT